MKNKMLVAVTSAILVFATPLSYAQTDADDQYNLGKMYAAGEGVRQDYVQARSWFEKAANQEDADAQYNLGVMYYNGQGVPKNVLTAKKWYGKACDNGDQGGCDKYAKLSQAGY